MGTTNKTNWINILHLYQPPTIDQATLKIVAEESYVPLLNFLKNNTNFKVTININSCLTYLLYENGYRHWIEDLGKLINSGQIEIIDTAAYHPILPLINKQEVVKQIKINIDMNRGLLKNKPPVTGFWLPECAYSFEVAKIIKKFGYKWIVLDEISHSGQIKKIAATKIYEIKKLGLQVVFRDREISRSFVPETMLKLMKDNLLPKILITATDGELYGHRHKDSFKNLQSIINNQNISTTTVSKYLQSLDKKDYCTPVASNWDAEEKELRKNLPYFLWYNPKNKIQMELWKLANLSYKLVEGHEKKSDYWSARLHLERGLSSCTFWWASGKDFFLFAPPAWKPDEVERGANQLIRAIRSLDIDKKTKIRAEKIYFRIKKKLWLKHWKKYA